MIQTNDQRIEQMLEVLKENGPAVRRAIQKEGVLWAAVYLKERDLSPEELDSILACALLLDWYGQEETEDCSVSFIRSAADHALKEINDHFLHLMEQLFSSSKEDQMMDLMAVLQEMKLGQRMFDRNGFVNDWMYLNGPEPQRRGLLDRWAVQFFKIIEKERNRR